MDMNVLLTYQYWQDFMHCTKGSPPLRWIQSGQDHDGQKELSEELHPLSPTLPLLLASEAADNETHMGARTELPSERMDLSFSLSLSSSLLCIHPLLISL